MSWQIEALQAVQLEYFILDNLTWLDFNGDASDDSERSETGSKGLLGVALVTNRHKLPCCSPPSRTGYQLDISASHLRLSATLPPAVIHVQNLHGTKVHSEDQTWQ